MSKPISRGFRGRRTKHADAARMPPAGPESCAAERGGGLFAVLVTIRGAACVDLGGMDGLDA